MIQLSTTFCLLTIIFIACQSAFVDRLTKCSINDGICQRKLLQQVLREIGKTGVPELGIPPTDPFSVKDLSANLLDILEIGMSDGIAKGVKECTVDRFETSIEDEHAVMEMTCDLTIKGKYWVKGSSPVIKSLLGGNDVHGEGLGKVIMTKLHMRFDYDFYIKERDGDIFIACKHNATKYSYDVEKTTFAANNIYLGDQEASGVIIPLLNQNSKFIMQTFGKSFMDLAMDIIYKLTHKFFDYVPTKYYIKDDLTHYIRK